MSRPGGVARAALAAVLLLAAVPAARAGHGGAGCGFSNWTARTAAVCSFDLQGAPIGVFAEVRDPTANRTVSIRVWVTQVNDELLAEDTGHAPHVWIECTARATGYATCADDLGVGEQADTIVPLGPRFFCHAAAAPADAAWTPEITFWCQSGSGIGLGT